MTRGWVSPPLLNFARKIYLSGPQQVLGADPALDPKKFADPWPILFTHASTNYRTPCMDIQNSVLLGERGGLGPAGPPLATLMHDAVRTCLHWV